MTSILCVNTTPNDVFIPLLMFRIEIKPSTFAELTECSF
jgi:hypothetical protein